MLCSVHMPMAQDPAVLMRGLHLSAHKGNFSSACQRGMQDVGDLARERGMLTCGVRCSARRGSAERNEPAAGMEGRIVGKRLGLG